MPKTTKVIAPVSPLVPVKPFEASSKPYCASAFTAPELTASEIVNLDRILELCNVPDIGPSPVDPNLTSRTRYTNALTTLEKSAAVFDYTFYQEAVFAEDIDEELLDKELVKAARNAGVPINHLPAAFGGNIPPAPAAVISSMMKEETGLATTPEDPEDSLSDLPTLRAASLKSAPTIKSRPSFSLNMRLFSMQNLNDSRPSTPSSIFSTFSRNTTRPTSSRKTKSRESIRNLFRPSSKSQRGAPSQLQLDASGVWRPVPATCDVPSLRSSSKSDHASTTSPSTTTTSSRTSASSFTELAATQDLDGKTLAKCTKVATFISLRNRCQDESKRFVDFAQHQRVALPLFFGRSRMYMESRMRIRLADLKEQQLKALEALENKHLMQELSSEDEHNVQTAEERVKNATALKHVGRRLEMLGDSATEVERSRLEDEKAALTKLAQRQKTDMRNLFRDQNREKVELKKNQQQELIDFERSLQEDYEQQIAEKEVLLLQNMTKLEELIHARAVKLVGRWWLLLQIWKKNQGERVMKPAGSAVNSPLPLSLFALHEDFAPIIAAFQ